MASMSRTISAWVEELTFEDLPPEVVDRAKGVTLQALSSALIGHKMPEAQQALAMMQEEEAGGGGAAPSGGGAVGTRTMGRPWRSA